MGRQNNLYEDVLEITADYFGPAADRFIDRQILHHLDKNPSELDRKDLSRLIEWISIAMAVLTDDLALRAEYTDRLQSLVRSEKGNITTD